MTFHPRRSIPWFQGLRGRAEQILQSRSIRRDADASPTARELETYEVELELQNEQLESMMEELRNSRERYRRLFELAPFAYLTLDVTGSVSDVNAAALALLGRSYGELVGVELSSFATPADALRVHRSLLEVTTLGVRRTLRARFSSSGGAELSLQLEIQAGAFPADGESGASEALRVALIELPSEEPSSKPGPSRSEPPAGQAARTQADAQDARSSPVHGQAVFVVDDSYATRSAVAEVLRDQGYTVYEAASCGEAKEVCRTVSETPKLALMDFVLPDGLGDGIAHSLRERWPDIFILYFSASDPSESRVLKAALAHTRTGFLGKPTDLDLIVEAVQLHLELADGGVIERESR